MRHSMLAILFTVLVAVNVWGQSAAQTEKSLRSRLVAIEATIEIDFGEMAEMMGMDDSVQEQVQRGSGLILSDGGIVAVGSNIVTSGSMAFMMAGPGGGGPEIEPDVTAIKVIGVDGKKRNAKVVGESKALGLTFLQIEKFDTKLTPMPAQSSTQATIGDDLHIFGRLTTTHGYATFLKKSYVSAIVKKPIEGILSGTASGSGETVTNAKGELVGLTASPDLETEDSESSFMMSTMQKPSGSIIVSMSTVLAAAPKIQAKSKETGKVEATEAGKRMSAIRGEWDAKMAAFQKAMSEAYEAADDKENFDFNGIEQPKFDSMYTELFKLIEDNPKDAEVKPSLNWLLSRPSDVALLWVLDYVMKGEGDSELTTNVFEAISSSFSGKVAKRLQSVSKSDKPEYAIPARYALALQTKEMAKIFEQVSMMPENQLKYMGDELGMSVEELKNTKPSDMEKKSEALLSALVTDADAKTLKHGRRTYAAQAARLLKIARSLKVGHEAPEIVGTDLEGQEFKLSDYRGKVVLLDFWGSW